MDCGQRAGDKVVTNCAFAVALREFFPDVRVYVPRIQAFGPFDYEHTIEMTADIAWFIRCFDVASPAQRLNMREESFIVDVPDSIIEKIGISQVYKILSESKTLEYVGGER